MDAFQHHERIKTFMTKEKALSFLNKMEAFIGSNYYREKLVRIAIMQDYNEYFSKCIFNEDLINCIEKHVKTSCPHERSLCINNYDMNCFLTFILEKYGGISKIVNAFNYGEHPYEVLRRPIRGSIRDDMFAGSQLNVMIIAFPPSYIEAVEQLKLFRRTEHYDRDLPKKFIFLGDTHDSPSTPERRVLLSEISGYWKLIEHVITRNDFGLCIFGHDVRVFTLKR
jgi:hypothetical protein